VDDISLYIEAADETTLRRALHAVLDHLHTLRKVGAASAALGQSTTGVAQNTHAAWFQAAHPPGTAGPASHVLEADAAEAYFSYLGFVSAASHIGFCGNGLAAAIARGLGLTDGPHPDGDHAQRQPLTRQPGAHQQPASQHDFWAHSRAGQWPNPEPPAPPAGPPPQPADSAGTLGAWLRWQRQSRGWSAAEMARRLRHAGRAAGDNQLPRPAILASYIRRWEHATITPTERYRLHYCAALGIRPPTFGLAPAIHHAQPAGPGPVPDA
jgi:hypothetical protein